MASGDRPALPGASRRYGITKPKNPVPCLDAAGRVVAVGDEVQRFQVGDEGWGIADRAYAENAAAKEGTLAHKPAVLSFKGATGRQPTLGDWLPGLIAAIRLDSIRG